MMQKSGVGDRQCDQADGLPPAFSDHPAQLQFRRGFWCSFLVNWGSHPYSRETIKTQDQLPVWEPLVHPASLIPIADHPEAGGI